MKQTSKSQDFPKRLLTVREVAEICAVSERTTRRWITQGDLKVIHLGRLIRITPQGLEEFLYAR